MKNKRIRLALVKYLNTRPYLNGLQETLPQECVEYLLLPPSGCANAMISGAADLALVPVGSLLRMPPVTMLTRFGIAAYKKVDSVFIFAHEPIEKISRLRLDPHSNTSNLLAKVLLRYHWCRGIQYMENPTRDFSDVLPGCAIVAIGDEAMRVRTHFPYAYDLAAEWYHWCGLPFVFAIWVYAPGTLQSEFIQQVESGLEVGLQDLPGVARQWGPVFGFTEEKALEYFSTSIVYRMNREMLLAIDIFLEKAAMV